MIPFETIGQMIREAAAKRASSDTEDFMVDDFAGGNVDDAYEMGLSDGEIAFARALLAELEG